MFPRCPPDAPDVPDVPDVPPAGGYLAHSLAILTDAAHLLTDFASIMISLFALWVSSRPPTKTMNFGWHRAGDTTLGMPWEHPWVPSRADQGVWGALGSPGEVLAP